MSDPPVRVLPRLTDENRFFWTSGEDGQLRFLTCRTCGHRVHPPAPVCPYCLTKTLEPRPVSGRATVATFTVNVQAWLPGFDPPYVVAMVEIDEQPSVRLTTNIVGCAPTDVFIGMAVRARFDHQEDVWLPLFEPDPEHSASGPGAGPEPGAGHDPGAGPDPSAGPDPGAERSGTDAGSA